VGASLATLADRLGTTFVPVDAFLVFPVPAGILVRLSGRPAAAAAKTQTPQVLIRGVLHMAAVCEICGKGPGFGKSVSHSHRRTSRRWDPNIQTVRAVSRPGGNKKRINVCTSCIKAGKVSRG
jgi:large subunit ribosomal protein L28